MKAVCYGAGVIGAGWAATFSLNGCETVLFGRHESTLQKALSQVAENLDYLAAAECITAEAAREAKARQEYLDKALAFYRSMKKEPVVLKKEKIGFIANRLSHAVLREVINLVDEGACSVEDADKALVYGPGLRWASIGQMMVGELGTPGGTAEMVKRFRPFAKNTL